jgi:hypothetical protein
MDALSNSTGATARRAATIHAEGLPMQGVNEKWLIHHGGTTVLDSGDRLDSAGEIKRVCFGGFRGGPIGYVFGDFISDIATSHVPMYPFAIFVRDFTNNYVYYLGDIPDQRGVNIKNFSPGQEVTIGSDTWIIFPQVSRTEDNIVGRTYYSGIAYKKVTA